MIVVRFVSVRVALANEVVGAKGSRVRHKIGKYRGMEKYQIRDVTGDASVAAATIRSRFDRLQLEAVTMLQIWEDSDGPPRWRYLCWR